MAQFEPTALAKALGRRRTGTVVDAVALEREVCDLVRATGLLIASDDERLFRELAATEPTARRLATHFREIAVAADPLAMLAAHPELHAAWLTMARARARRWPALTAEWAARLTGPDRPAWDALDADEQHAVRSLATHLARFHAAQAPVGRERRADIDTIIAGLAEIFARHTGFAQHEFDLPHSPASRFVGFCNLVLSDLVDASQYSRLAVSRRWQRLKALHRDGLPPKPKRSRPRARPRIMKTQVQA